MSREPTNASRDAVLWSLRYGERHRLERITEFPKGIAPPAKVRLYWRRDHYVLQWWDRRTKRTLSDRVNEDFVAAISRAREIERQMEEVGHTHPGCRKLTFRDLIAGFLTDTRRRAASGEIDARTVTRYESALAYLSLFTEQPLVARSYPHPGRVDRQFVQEFCAFLQAQLVSPNGHPSTPRRPMQAPHYVLEIVRASFNWAVDPERGKLLSTAFRNPFLARTGLLRRPAPDLTREPPITLTMAEDFIGACDHFQLRLFVPLILFGLRATEPAWLFQEDLANGWLNVCCHPELDYLTKGRRDKKFPIDGVLADLLAGSETAGLMLRQQLPAPAGTPTAGSASFKTLVAAYRQDCARHKDLSLVQRREIRDRLLKQEGGLSYDGINGQFRRIARGLGWPPGATLKGFRHLFATALENSGCPETYRRYFLGHSPGRAASLSYTHLDQIRRHFERFTADEFAPILKAIHARAGASATAETMEERQELSTRRPADETPGVASGDMQAGLKPRPGVPPQRGSDSHSI